LQKWKDLYEISPCSHSPWGITFHKKINFFELSEFKEGLFEIQDEASQLTADLVAVEPKEKVLDFCAGSGGKTLAFAPKMQNSGQIYLHDIRLAVLSEAQKRLRRAGVQNAQLLLPTDERKKRMLKEKMDWVLVDVPCSGTGTLRRNPDMKWKLDLSLIERLVAEQRQIFEQALSFLRPGGHIVYATCSILPQENQEQISFFQEKFKLELSKPPFHSFPKRGGMDGFFGAILKS
jgi:16S rRNA (cytosine967-C5)-methyltransferase